MQTIKTMFRSPRFIVGFIMVLTIVCYALFIPMIFTADPKESRAESPYYVEFEDLHAALLAEDDAAIEALAEEFRFSDPVSNAAISDAEADLAAAVDELQAAYVDGDKNAMAQLCCKISALLAERNRLCKLNKN